MFAPGAYSAGKPRIAGRASEAAGGERPADRRTPAGERRLFPAKFVTDAVRLAWILLAAAWKRDFVLLKFGKKYCRVYRGKMENV